MRFEQYEQFGLQLGFEQYEVRTVRFTELFEPIYEKFKRLTKLTVGMKFEVFLHTLQSYNFHLRWIGLEIVDI